MAELNVAKILERLIEIEKKIIDSPLTDALMMQEKLEKLFKRMNDNVTIEMKTKFLDILTIVFEKMKKENYSIDNWIFDEINDQKNCMQISHDLLQKLNEKIKQLNSK